MGSDFLYHIGFSRDELKDLFHDVKVSHCLLFAVLNQLLHYKILLLVCSYGRKFQKNG